MMSSERQDIDPLDYTVLHVCIFRRYEIEMVRGAGYIGWLIHNSGFFTPHSSCIEKASHNIKEALVLDYKRHFIHNIG